MTKYTDDEVQKSINGLGEFLEWAKSQHLVGETSAWKEAATVIWSASEYLKAKEVIERYAIPDVKHGDENPHRTSCAACDARVARK